MKRFLPLGILALALLFVRADAQLPQLTCCTSGGSGGTGDVAGPASSTDNAVARYDGTTGKLLQDSLAYITDAGAIQLGGKTSTETAIIPSGTNIKVRKADDSGWGTVHSQGADFYSGTDTSARLIAIYAGAGFEEISLASGLQLKWTNNATSAGGGDTGLKRAAAGVVQATDGASGLGWLQWAGESYLAADATNATATLATTGLSATVKSGRKYFFKCVLYVSDSVAAEGVQIDFGGGSAAAANFRAHVTAFDTALNFSSQVTSLTGTASAGTFTGSGMLEVHGSFEPSGNGTFIPRFAQATHVTGTVTLFRGSHLVLWDAP